MSTSNDVESVRPRFHVVAPYGWMNDPCAPGYVPKTNKYLLFYQWNPNGTHWADISWGQVESSDLVFWKRVGQEPILKPSETYDYGGVFTGCLHVAESGDLTIVYTSATDLPIHWTRRHKRGSESVSLAVSVDGGRTWKRHSSNPVLPHEPLHIEVTGFRDPFVSPWPSMDQLLDATTPGLYALVSGGTRAGPNTFLYLIDPKNLAKWEFIAPLVNLPPHHRVVPPTDALSPVNGLKGSSVSNGESVCHMGEKTASRPAEPPNQNSSACRSTDLHSHTFPTQATSPLNPCPDLGCNWECTTFTTLRSLDACGDQREVILPSSEGVADPARYQKYRETHPEKPCRTAKGANWIFGQLTLAPSFDGQQGIANRSKPQFIPTVSGLLDHGGLYACTIFTDPHKRTILWGWAVEDDLTPENLSRKGWTGCLGLPREIFLLSIRTVTRALHTSLDQVEGIEWESGTGFTLGIRPIAELSTLRRRTFVDAAVTGLVHSSVPQQIEIQIIASLTPTSTINLHVKHNESLSIRTSIVFSASAEKLYVDRSASTRALDVNTMEESGPFTLFASGDFNQAYEQLNLRVFIDGDLVEVFANDRFALTTRTYAPRVGCGGISVELDGGEIERVRVWELGSIGLEDGG